MTQMTQIGRQMSAGAIVLLCAAAPGCIERTVTIRTEPDDALVYLNDQEVGRSPVTVPFTWYGDYDIVVRKQGYQTLKTHHRIHAPWRQWPIIDLVTECFVPFTIHDRHEFPIYELQPAQLPSKDDVIARADEMRVRVEGPAEPKETATGATPHGEETKEN